MVIYLFSRVNGEGGGKTKAMARKAVARLRQWRWHMLEHTGTIDKVIEAYYQQTNYVMN